MKGCSSEEVRSNSNEVVINILFKLSNLCEVVQLKQFQLGGWIPPEIMLTQSSLAGQQGAGVWHGADLGNLNIGYLLSASFPR